MNSRKLRGYRISVRARVPQQEMTDPEDRLEDPSGDYDRWAFDEESALDRFHETVPIGCLDDFEITCSPLKAAENKPQ
jgi:hypothetical protein